MTAHTIRQAEIAMGSSAAIMAEYFFQRRMGWPATPESILQLAARNPAVTSLIWC